MVVSCSSYGCSNRFIKESEITFHCFPLKNEELLKKWIDALQRKNFKATKYSRLCSTHFKTSDFLKRPGSYRRQLHPNAVPSIFPFSHLLHRKVEVDSASNSFIEDRFNSGNLEEKDTDISEDPLRIEDVHKSENSLGSQHDTQNSERGDCNSQLLEKQTRDLQVEPRGSVIKFDKGIQSTECAMPTTVAMLRKKIRTLNLKVKRKEKKILDLKSLVKSLKKNGTLEASLKNSCGITEEEFYNVYKNKKKSPVARQYSPEIKKFALKLYNKLPKAYSFCRKILALPQPSLPSGSQM